MKHKWQSLRVGDRIRFVRVPSESLQREFNLPTDTRELYELLVATREALEIIEIQEYDRDTPVASYEDLRDPTAPISHALVIDDFDDGCWELVE